MATNTHVTLVRTLVVAVLFTGVGVVSDVQAKPVNEAAMSALKLAKHYYKKENFKKAASLFVEAFDLEPNPLFLYNAGRALQRGFMLDKAEQVFTRFLEIEKKGKFVGADHEAAKRRAAMRLKEIKSTRSQLDQARQRGRDDEKTQTQNKGQGADAQTADAAQKKAADATDAKNPASVVAPKPADKIGSKVAPTSSWKTPAAFGLMGAGAGLLGYGLWLLNDLSTRADVLDEQTRSGLKNNGKLTGSDAQTYQMKMEGLRADQNTAFVVVGVGVLAAGAGGYLLSTVSGVRKVALVPHVGGRGATLSVRF